MSVISMLICIVMLMGTTFAWFTDSVVSGKNTIVAGNLDVDLEYSEDLVSWKSVEGMTDLFDVNALWEPGHTEVIYLRVSNLGTLALKYQFSTTFENTVIGKSVLGNDIELSDYIEYGIKEGVTAKYATREAARADVTGVPLDAYTMAGELKANQTSAPIAYVVYMPETVGNEANHVTGTDAPVVELGVNLVATQVEHENDSFGNDYDKDAVYADTYVWEADDFADAIAGGGVVALMTDVNVDSVTVEKGVSTTLNLNGHNISGTSTKDTGNQSSFKVKGNLTVEGTGVVSHVHTGANMGWNNLTAVFSVEGGTLTLGENVSVINNGGSDMAYGVDVNSTLGATTLNVNGATIYSTYTGVRLFTNNKTQAATVNFNDGFIEGGNRDIWNQISSAAIPAENGVVNIADGYNYTTEPSTNGGAKYFFVDYLVATDDDSLDDAIKGGATTLVLSSGNYIIPDSAQGKTLTIVGSGDTVIATQDDGSYEGCDYSLDGAKVTFENVTINTDSRTYTGYARCSATYNNCTINGTYTLYGESEFNNCTFNVTGDVYNLWTWGAPKATFNGCTFNSDGKAVLLYGTANTNMTVNDCTFNDNGGLDDLKAAIEIGNDYGKSYTLTVNNTVVNGYEINDKGINTGTT
ncbi:MAG: hypothetical protein J6K33_01085, partial [Alistipes sp.]|nr:hypothetical protein [Alistipes sp.]